MENLDLLITFWNKWMMLPSFIIGFLGVIIFILSNSELLNFLKNKRKTGMFLIGQLVLIWAIGFSLFAFFESKAQIELITFLNSPDLELKINGNKINSNQSKKIFAEIKKIEDFPSNHPTLKKEMSFEIKSKIETLTLRIVQNSKNKNEFWVDSDKYKSTNINTFGQLNSNLFMEYYSGQHSKN